MIGVSGEAEVFKLMTNYEPFAIQGDSTCITSLEVDVTKALGLCPLATEGTQELGVIVVAHRRELIEQISKTLDKFGIEHGVILSGKKIDYSKRVQVASIQTLSRRAAHGDGAHGDEVNPKVWTD